MDSFAGLTAIVTGAGSGIGAATASLFAEAGAAVAVIDRHAAHAEAVAGAIVRAGGQARAYTLDVSDPAAAQACFDAVASELGGIDILVNNAGIATVNTIEDMPFADWQSVLDVNLGGAFICLKAALPHLKRRGGAVVNVASLAAKRISYHGGANYTAAKSGLLGLTRHAAYEFAGHGIRVNAVCPGPVLTPLVEEKTTEREREHTAGLIPLGRWVLPLDVARAIVFLAGPQSAMCSGTDLDVDGALLVSNGTPYAEYMARRHAAAAARSGAQGVAA